MFKFKTDDLIKIAKSKSSIIIFVVIVVVLLIFK